MFILKSFHVNLHGGGTLAAASKRILETRGTGARTVTAEGTRHFLEQRLFRLPSLFSVPRRWTATAPSSFKPLRDGACFPSKPNPATSCKRFVSKFPNVTTTPKQTRKGHNSVDWYRAKCDPASGSYLLVDSYEKLGSLKNARAADGDLTSRGDRFWTVNRLLRPTNTRVGHLGEFRVRKRL